MYIRIVEFKDGEVLRRSTRIRSFGFRVSGFRSGAARDSGFGCWIRVVPSKNSMMQRDCAAYIPGFGFRGLGFRVSNFGLRVPGFRLSVQGGEDLGFRVSDLGRTVEVFEDGEVVFSGDAP